MSGNVLPLAEDALSEADISQIFRIAAREVLCEHFAHAAMRKYTDEEIPSRRIARMVDDLQAGPITLDGAQKVFLARLIARWVMSNDESSPLYARQRRYCRLLQPGPDLDTQARQGLEEYIGPDHNGSMKHSGAKVASELSRHYN